MKISMQPSANYVTRQGLFDNQTFGILTDRQIERYQRLGKYGPTALQSAQMQPAKGRRLLSKRKQFINSLIG